jgi:hypothetical protein
VAPDLTAGTDGWGQPWGTLRWGPIEAVTAVVPIDVAWLLSALVITLAALRALRQRRK